MSELLAELFSSRVRASVLGYLLLRPHLAFSLTDLSRRLELPVSSLQHECYKLARLGVLVDRRSGATRRYCPNAEWLLLAPLTSLVIRAIGEETAYQAALEDVPGLEFALLAGTLAAGANTVGVGYLVLVGELSTEAVDGALARIMVVLRAIAWPGQLELTYFRPVEWRGRIEAGDAFVRALIREDHLTLAGTPPESAFAQQPGLM